MRRARAPGRRSRPRHVSAATFLVLVTLLITWLVVGWDHIVTPLVDDPQAVDVVFVIGPAETRMPPAMDLAHETGAGLLLTTTSVDPVTGQPYPRDYCGTERANITVECVIPDPYTTRGEARLLGARASAEGWQRVAVVTSTPHSARTRLLMERCTDAEVLVWPVDGDRGLLSWAGQFVYQSGAWVKTQILRDC
jgi:uncharacterized SAM-binding protein YcdF (DUF218 family)